jgi:hypothetical protein
VCEFVMPSKRARLLNYSPPSASPPGRRECYTARQTPRRVRFVWSATLDTLSTRSLRSFVRLVFCRIGMPHQEIPK